MAKKNLLLVDSDAKSQRLLEVSLRKAGFSVTTAVNGADALDKVGLSTPDLIISDTKMPTLDGFEFCERLKADAKTKNIPFVFLTAQKNIEHKIRGLELGVDDYLTKPIYLKEVVTRIRILLERREKETLERRDRSGFGGFLGDMGVVDLLQTIEIGRKTGILTLKNGPQEGKIFFRSGKVVDAEMGKLRGEKAIYRFLVWADGNFEIDFINHDRADVIEVSTQGLLMEGMRRVDEWGLMLEQLPPLDSRFDIDYREFASRLAEIPDEVNAILKLFDGERTLMEIVDASDFGDLEALNIISKLFFEGLIYDITVRPPADEQAVARVQNWLEQPMPPAPPTETGLVDVDAALAEPAVEPAQFAVEPALPTLEPAQPEAAAAPEVPTEPAAEQPVPIDSAIAPEANPPLLLSDATPEGAASAEISPGPEPEVASASSPSASLALQEAPEELVAASAATQPTDVVGRPEWPADESWDDVVAPVSERELLAVLEAQRDTESSATDEAPTPAASAADSAPVAVETSPEQADASWVGPEVIAAAEEAARDAGEPQASAPGPVEEEEAPAGPAAIAPAAEPPPAERSLESALAEELSAAPSASSGEEAAVPVASTTAPSAPALEIIPLTTVATRPAAPASAEATSPIAASDTGEEADFFSAPEAQEGETPLTPINVRRDDLPPLLPSAPPSAVALDSGRGFWLRAAGLSALLIAVGFIAAVAVSRGGLSWVSELFGGAGDGQSIAATQAAADAAAPLSATDAAQFGPAIATATDAAVPLPATDAAPAGPAIATATDAAVPSATTDAARVGPAVSAATDVDAAPAETFESLVKRGQSLAERGQLKAAAASYRKALAINSKSPEAHTALANAYYEMDQLVAAERSLKQALKLNEKYAPAYVLLGTVYQSLDRVPEAIKAYDSYLALAPGGPFARDVRDIVSKLRNQR
ncbi:MAG: response regulator [Deltaproteobacteria bacterium]|nr:response regulator [Deltaproteobacteria bacterium]